MIDASARPALAATLELEVAVQEDCLAAAQSCTLLEMNILYDLRHGIYASNGGGRAIAHSGRRPGARSDQPVSR